MDACADDGATGRERAQSLGNELPRRGEDDRRIEIGCGRIAPRAGPLGPDLPGQRPRLRVALTCEREHTPALRRGDLADDVSRGAESVEAEPLPLSRQPQGSVTDQASAEQRGGVLIRVVA